MDPLPILHVSNRTACRADRIAIVEVSDQMVERLGPDFMDAILAKLPGDAVPFPAVDDEPSGKVLMVIRSRSFALVPAGGVVPVLAIKWARPRAGISATD